jgi:hypothetical protein
VEVVTGTITTITKINYACCGSNIFLKIPLTAQVRSGSRPRVAQEIRILLVWCDGDGDPITRQSSALPRTRGTNRSKPPETCQVEHLHASCRLVRSPAVLRTGTTCSKHKTNREIGGESNLRVAEPGIKISSALLAFYTCPATTTAQGRGKNESKHQESSGKGHLAWDIGRIGASLVLVRVG